MRTFSLVMLSAPGAFLRFPKLRTCSLVMLAAPGAFLRFRDVVAVIMSLHQVLIGSPLLLHVMIGIYSMSVKTLKFSSKESLLLSWYIFW